MRIKIGWILVWEFIFPTVVVAGPCYASGKIFSLFTSEINPAIRLECDITPDICDLQSGIETISNMRIQ